MQKAHLSIEKRRHPRVTVTVPVRFKPISKPAERERILAEAGDRPQGQTRNLAVGGVALITKEPLKKGELVKIELDLPGHSQPVRAFAEVVWAYPEEQGIHAGLHFLAVKSEDEDLISFFVLNLLKGGLA